MRGSTFTLEATMVIEECCNCGIPFGISEYHQNRLRESHETFYCPSGHAQSYSGLSESEILKRKLKEQEKKLANAQFEVMAAEEKVISANKRMKRLEKRIANGVCPCCHRQFVSLAQHMKRQHPEFQEAALLAQGGGE